jgi:hypothetical protein
MRYLLAFFLLIGSAKAVEFNWYGYATGVQTQPGWTPYSNPPAGEAAGGAPRWNGASAEANAFVSSTTAQIPAAQIPAGTYRISVKLYSYSAQNNNVYGVARAGGALTTGAMFNSGDKDGAWSTFGTLDVPVATDRIDLRFWTTNDVLGVNLNVITLLGVYINTDPNLAVTSGDYVQKWTLDTTTTDASASIAGNYAYNSSFELPPAESGITVNSADGRTYSIDDCWKSGDAHHGSRYLSVIMDKCAASGTPVLPLTVVNFPTVHLRPNKVHSMSVWARASVLPATIQLAIRNPILVPAGYGFPVQPLMQTANTALTTSWALYTLQAQIPREYPYSDFSPELNLISTAGARIEIDQVALHEGATALAWAPAYQRELTISSSYDGGTHYIEDGSPILKLDVMDYGTGGADTVIIQAYHEGTAIWNSSISITTTSSGLLTSDITIPVTKLGPYRINARLNSGGPWIEGTFNLVHHPRDVPASDRRIGTDPPGSHWVNQNLQRLGVRSIRQLSPGTWYRWSLSEVTSGNYTFYDDFSEATTQYGAPVIGNLYHQMPSWAPRTMLMYTNVVGAGFQVGEVVTQGAASGTVTWASGPTDILKGVLQLSGATGTFGTVGNIVGGTSGTTAVGAPIIAGGLVQIAATVDLPRYAQWAANMVSHFTNVTYWEIWNEPSATSGGNINSDFGMHFYAQSVKMTADTIKAANPNAKIVAPGGLQIDTQVITRANLFWNALPAATKDKIDAIGFHIYPDAGGFAASVGSWIASTGKPGFNTESGWEDLGIRMGWQAPWYNLGFPVQPYQYTQMKVRGAQASGMMVATNIMSILGSGFTKHDYYDCRVYHSAKDVEKHYTLLDGNDVFKPKACILSWAEYALAGSQGTFQAPIAGSPNGIFAYTLTSGLDGKDWMVIYSTVGNKRLIWPTMNWSMYDVYDRYGNQLTPPASNMIDFGLGGVYVKAKATTAADMRTALAALGTGTSSLADTTAPSLIWQYLPGPTVRPLDNSYLTARWIAYDDVTVIQPATPNAMTYRYQVNGGAWSVWTGTTHVEFNNLASGTYVINVEARDLALNTAALTGSFTIP